MALRYQKCNTLEEKADGDHNSTGNWEVIQSFKIQVHLAGSVSILTGQQRLLYISGLGWFRSDLSLCPVSRVTCAPVQKLHPPRDGLWPHIPGTLNTLKDLSWEP